MKKIEIWHYRSKIGRDTMALKTYWDDYGSMTGFTLADEVVRIQLRLGSYIDAPGLWAVHILEGELRWLRLYKIVESSLGLILDADFSWPGQEAASPTRVTHWPPKS